jgi:hypothetical protein
MQVILGLPHDCAAAMLLDHVLYEKHLCVRPCAPFRPAPCATALLPHADDRLLDSVDREVVKSCVSTVIFDYWGKAAATAWLDGNCKNNECAHI